MTEINVANYTLGLDIGVSSVGWGVTDNDTGEIIDAGVRLFEEASRNANEDRRNYRGSRRLKRRRTHRLERFKELVNQYKLSTEGIGIIDPYVARKNSIYEKVSEETLIAGLYHLVKRRGVVLDTPMEETTSENELSTKEQLSRNSKLLEAKYICEIQLDRLQEFGGTIRTHENRFRTSDYLKEIQAIIKTQKIYHNNIPEDFFEDVVQLIETRRAYYEGPGSKKSPTKYGRYFIDENGLLQEMSMIDKMRGTCTYFPEELRIARMSYTANLFDLLSGDLNKLQINGEYLSREDKEYLINTFIKKGKNITMNGILKYKGAPSNAIVTGSRIDLKSDKPLFTEFKGYKIIYKIIKAHKIDESILDDTKTLDEIINILTSEKAFNRRRNQMTKVLDKYEVKAREQLIERLTELNDFKGFHSLSKKAMDLIMDELLDANKNQIELYSELKLNEKRLSKIARNKKIKFDDEAILSSVAKRAHRETIKIVNSLRDKYGEFTSIVVETAREKNSEDRRLSYSRFQRDMGKFEKRMATLLSVKKLAELKLTGKQHLALKLWDAQDCKCIYSGKSIAIHDIVNNFTMFEIDHIIPLSISFDDSQSNKVLCYHSENQKKGQRTPFHYFQTGKSKRSFDEYRIDVLNLSKAKKINNKKKEYLLEIRDVKNNKDLQKQFINRNLVDTQYATRSLTITLKTFFKVNDIDTTVFSIRGSFTAALRRRMRLDKDREAGHAHHAIDALIVASIGKMPVFKFFNEFEVTEQGVIFQKETGEILNEKDFYEHKFIQFLRSIQNYEPKIKYSHKVDRKANRTMTNQTIYGTRKDGDDVYYLGKSGNIYELDKKKAASVITRLNNKPETFLIHTHNPELFKKIITIVKEYDKADNPFRAYYDENGYILKDGKVPIKNLRYKDRKLGIHLSIKENYPNTKNDVVLLSIKGLRIDLYKNEKGHYKYIGVPYHWFRKQGNTMVLDMELYEAEMNKEYKNIDDSYEFQLSLYKNDLFEYEKSGERYERIFRGDAMPRANKIEVDFVHKRKKNRTEGFLTISTVTNLIKYNVDILGGKHKIIKEKFKKTLQLI